MMKTTKAPKVTLLLLTAVIITVSCNKTDDPGSELPEASCSIVERTSVKGNNQPSVTQINYNNDGSLSSANITRSNYNSQAAWDYAPHKIIHEWYNDDKIVNKKYIDLDAKGDPVKIIIDFYDNNGDVYHTNMISFEYNGQRQLIKSVLKSGNDPETVTNYTWAGGNMIKAAGENYTDTYEYYTNLPIQQADYTALPYELSSGIRFFNNKNLLKSWDSQGNGFVRTYNYQFDADGKISKYTVKQTANNVTEDTEVSFEYICK
ncbi:hypothetical protein [Sinomicrobium weinanense]|uniref:DUF4595 domain-containing protein n=1 Tax=Sinomicrobium weinanense TaxID=2842200 RepID=A0A926JSF2_9FLAO|nr:hypothetical protein [Sinomicrobium weinanense]MBC9796655.1 hypothetical protein [Sinomicrobium weinanense]MBU3124905.1 hypothetical protein [Sinomicrobium weinanense]